MTSEELFDLLIRVLPDEVDVAVNMKTGEVVFLGLEDDE